MKTGGWEAAPVCRAGEGCWSGEGGRGESEAAWPVSTSHHHTTPSEAELEMPSPQHRRLALSPSTHSPDLTRRGRLLLLSSSLLCLQPGLQAGVGALMVVGGPGGTCEVRLSVVRTLTVTGWTLSPSRLVNITGRRTGKAQRVDTINMVRPDLSPGSRSQAIVIIPTRNIEIHFRPSEPRRTE